MGFEQEKTIEEANISRFELDGHVRLKMRVRSSIANEDVDLG